MLYAALFLDVAALPTDPPLFVIPQEAVVEDLRVNELTIASTTLDVSLSTMYPLLGPPVPLPGTEL